MAMSVKGRKFRQARQKPTEHGYTLKVLLQAKHAVEGNRLPGGRKSRTEQTRHAFVDTFGQPWTDAATVDEEVCTGCGLGPHLWKGNRGKGYTRGGERYCCQPCAHELECACQP